MLENSQKCELLVEHLLVLSYDVLDSDMVCTLVGLDSLLYQETYAYLCNNTIPPHLTKTQQQTFIHWSPCLSVLEDTLFQRNFDGTLLRFLDKDKVEQVLCEVHKGIYGARSSGLTLAKKLLHTRYY